MSRSLAYEQVFVSLLDDVEALLDFHPSKKAARGRPGGKTGPLLRSAVILLTTAWENYVEAVAKETGAFCVESAGDDPRNLHVALRKKLGESKNPWALAGDAWREAASRCVGAEANALNTPSVKRVESLLLLACGRENALHSISWENAPNDWVLESLDEFVLKIRGEIVHRGTTPGPLSKAGVVFWVNFLKRLATRLDKTLQQHLKDTWGESPW